MASGDHLPVAPPAPPQPIPQNNYQPQNGQPQSQHYQAGEKGTDGDDGSYDERWNDPSFGGNGGGRAISAPRAAPQQQQYNNYNNNYNYQQQQAPIPAGPPANVPQYNNRQYTEPQYTTQNPHRFQPPGKLSLNRTPDGYSYSFNKV